MPGDLARRALAALEGGQERHLIVTGPIESGKTRALAALATALRERGVRVGGILAPRVIHGGRTIGYDVTDLVGDRSVPLARLEPPGQRVGRYFLRPAGLRAAAEAIEAGIREADIVLVDEVGRAEIAGRGHAPSVRALASSDVPAVLAVRAGLADDVIHAFGLDCQSPFTLPAPR